MSHPDDAKHVVPEATAVVKAAKTMIEQLNQRIAELEACIDGDDKVNPGLLLRYCEKYNKTIDYCKRGLVSPGRRGRRGRRHAAYPLASE